MLFRHSNIELDKAVLYMYLLYQIQLDICIF